MNKTGRVRGLIFRAIRIVAANKLKFTVDDIPMPKDQAGRNLEVLMKLGEIVRIKRAVRTGWADDVIPAIFQRTPSLRRPELTNKLTHKRNERRTITTRAQSDVRNTAWDNGSMGSAERI